MIRNFKDEAYKQWRISVYKRDRFKCRFPGCCVRGKSLNAHHIKPWSLYPTLRFILSNGITLCKRHHKLISGKEQQYEPLFRSIVDKGI